METRLQSINGDTVLEITETKEVKVRHSKNILLSRKTVLEDMQGRMANELAAIDKVLKQMDDEEAKQVGERKA